MELIGVVGYGLASAAFFVFILLLLAAKNNTLSGRIILLSSTVTLLASFVAAGQIQYSISLRNVLILENVKYLLWFFLIVSTQLRLFDFYSFLHHKSVKIHLFFWPVLSLTCWIMSIYSPEGFKYIFILFLVLSLSTIVALEQLYRNADAKAKWALWPLTIALGTSVVFDFVIFAQAVMVKQLDFSFWYARGYLITIAMPMLLISTRRMKNWSVDVFISREVVFYSSMLLISGVYLLLLAIAGYAINFIGGHWGSVISIVFLALGSTVLLALLITERLRREVKVFITKHFYANKYDYRLEWLKLIEQLESSNNEDCYQTATDIICSSINATKGALVTKEPNSHYKCLYRTHDDFEVNHMGLFSTVEDFYKHNLWIIDIREFTYVEDSYPNLMLNLDLCSENQIDLIIPILSGNKLYGMFVLSLGHTKNYLNWEDRDLLFAITKQLSNYLSLNEANSRLAESKQFEAFHRMSAFLVHDLKNVQAQLGLINNNAKRHRDNPAFIDDVFETIESATTRLDKVLTQLRNKQMAETTKSAIELNTLLTNIVAQRNVNKPSVDIEIDGKFSLEIEEQELQSILNHIIQNAQEATADDGWVKVKVSNEQSMLRIAVIDNGAGMSEAFMKNRLFKPFDTTKGNAGMGIGAFEAKQFIESQGGSVQVTSIENEGTIFQIALPSDNNYTRL